MGTRCISILRNHWHVLLIVPLVVIVMTWPTFARIFDGDEFWLHVEHRDKWLRFWDAWHLERVFAGQAELFYTDSLFHPEGVSLAWQHVIYPHAVLFLIFEKVMPADSAYNLLFLLMLCFNAFCAYLLIYYFINDKWIALFGAVVAAVSVPFPHGSTSPDLILIGTLPLTIYFLYRAVEECRWRFAALAGLCAGFTAFISLYTLVFILFTTSICAVYLALSRWRQPAFWCQLLMIIVICGSIALRIYPSRRCTRLPSGIGILSRPRTQQRCYGFLRPFTQSLFRRNLAFPVQCPLRINAQESVFGLHQPVFHLLRSPVQALQAIASAMGRGAAVFCLDEARQLSNI